MNNQGLPANPQVITVPMTHVSAAQPPFYPQNIPGIPAVQQFLPQICGAFAVEAQRNAQANPIRTLAYNVLAQDNWNNPTFNQLLQMGALILSCEFAKQRGAIHVGDLANTIVPEVLQLFSGLITANYPEMTRYLTTDAWNGACAAGNKLMGIVQSCQQQMQQGINTASNVGFQNQGGWQTGGMASPGVMGGVNYGIQGTAARQDLRADQRFFDTPKSGGPAFGTLSIKAPVSRSAPDYTVPALGNSPAVALEPIAPPKKEEPSVVTKNTNLTLADWQSSEDQPYLIGFSPRTHMQEFALNKQGEVRQLIKARPQTMDYNDHGAPYPDFMGKQPWKDNFQAVAESTTRLMAAINTEEELIRDEPEHEPYAQGDILVSQEIFYDNYFNNCLSWVRRRRREAREEHPNLQAFTMTCNLKTLLLEDDLEQNEALAEDHTVLNGVALQKNFVEVKRQLERLSDEYKRLHLRRFNVILTREVNILLRHQLNIQMSISDFFEDIEDVDAVILKDFGAVVHAAWVNHIEDHIGRLFAIPNEDHEYSDIDIVGQQTPKTEIDRYCTMTLLSVPALALDLDIPAGKSVMLDAMLSPMLYSIAHHYLPAVQLADSIHRHFVVTQDGLVFEIFSGWLVESSKLIRFVGDDL